VIFRERKKRLEYKGLVSMIDFSDELCVNDRWQILSN